MAAFSLYRKRLIPQELILLKDDEIISFEDNRLVTKWNVIHPKGEFDCGISCYCLNEGIKVSKFMKADGSLVLWYIDIITHNFTDNNNSLIVTDLLADVLIYPDGTVRTVDLDELADAFESGLITKEQLTYVLRTVNDLLTQIYNGSFSRMQDYLNCIE